MNTRPLSDFLSQDNTKTNEFNSSLSIKHLINDLTKSFPIKENTREVWAFSNERNLQQVLEELDQIPNICSKKNGVVFVIGESHIITMLPRLAKIAKLIILADIDSNIHLHTKHLLACLDHSATIEEFIQQYKVNNPIVGCRIAATDLGLLRQPHFYTIEILVDLLMGKTGEGKYDLQKYDFLQTPSLYQACKEAAKKLSFVQIGFDLSNISQCETLSSCLKMHDAEFVLCNFSNVHSSYKHDDNFIRSIKSLMSTSQAYYIMFSDFYYKFDYLSTSLSKGLDQYVYNYFSDGLDKNSNITALNQFGLLKPSSNLIALAKPVLLKIKCNSIPSIISLSQDRIVCKTSKNTLCVFYLNDNDEPKYFNGHDRSIHHILLVSDQLLVSADKYHLHLWNISTNESIQHRKSQDKITCIGKLSNDELLVATEMMQSKKMQHCNIYTGIINIWNIRTNEWKEIFKTNFFITQMVMLSNYQLAMTSYNMDGVQVRSILTGTVMQPLIGHHGGITCLEKISDDILLTGSQDNDIRIWYTRLGRCIKFKGHTAGVYRIKQISDNEFMSLSHDDTCRTWNLKTGKCIVCIDLSAYLDGSYLESLAKTSIGIAVGTASGQIYLLPTTNEKIQFQYKSRTIKNEF